MPIFASSRDAKEYLIGRIVEEAQRVGVQLSDVETKMMYFSEAAPTVPEFWGVNEAFERDYDSFEYEKKIAKLIRSLCARDEERDTKGRVAWKQAVKRLSLEDHYLNVMINGAGVPEWLGPRDASFRRLLRLGVLGVALFLVCAAALMGYWILDR